MFKPSTFRPVGTSFKYGYSESTRPFASPAAIEARRVAAVKLAEKHRRDTLPREFAKPKQISYGVEATEGTTTESASRGAGMVSFTKPQKSYKVVALKRKKK